MEISSSHIITSVISAGFVSALFGGLVAWINARHKNKLAEATAAHQNQRENREDNMATLVTARTAYRTALDNRDAAAIVRDAAIRALLQALAGNQAE